MPAAGAILACRSTRCTGGPREREHRDRSRRHHRVFLRRAAHLGQLRLDQGLLERQKKDYARNNAKFVAEDEARSARRHAVNDVTVDPKHRSALDQIRTGIEETQAQIEERIWTIDECRRIIAGQTRLEAIETTMRLREKAAEAKRAA